MFHRVVDLDGWRVHAPTRTHTQGCVHAHLNMHTHAHRERAGGGGEGGALTERDRDRERVLLFSRSIILQQHTVSLCSVKYICSSIQPL